ncbi:MAG: molybdopterin-dependent oxidoreductase [Pseudomonadales bacterium]
MEINATRRAFMRSAAGAGCGLLLGITFRAAATADPLENVPGHLRPLAWDPHAFIRVDTDNTVTVFCKHTEMGQGIHTGMSTVVAEELGATWSQMRATGARADTSLYSNLLWEEQMTGGSTSLVNSYDQLREVAAAARQMLAAAGASVWGVRVAEVLVADGEVRHPPSARRLAFGDLADEAARQPIPETVALKRPEASRLVGSRLPRTDVPAKVDGTAVYTLDFRLPGMLTAVVVHPPRFGASLASFDDRAARAMPGVVDVVEIPSGIALLAHSFWEAVRARDRLQVKWHDAAACTLGSADIVARFKGLSDTPGVVARETGAVTPALSDAAVVIEADFEFPYLAHAALEPMNCVVRLSAGRCEIWNAAQQQTRDQAMAAAILGIDPDKVEVTMLYAGGAFGRRACSDYTGEAIHIAKAIEGRAPVKLVWSREDDMQAGQFRPLNYHRMWGGLDADGNVVAWQHRLIGQSIAARHSPDWIVDGVDEMSVEGAHDHPYRFANERVDLHSPEVPVPVLWYRGTGGTHAVFSVEVFIDELAAAAGMDPADFRRRHLQDDARLQNVLDLALTGSNWGSPVEPGRGRGLAICRQRDTRMAQVAEVSVKNGSLSIDRVVTAIDCGLTINPDIVVAQVESGTVFGLSSTIASEITLAEGYVQQSNFDAYPVLRMDQMPEIEVHLVESNEPLSGVGDMTPMLIAPAVANAFYAATGRRIRKLPIGPLS